MFKKISRFDIQTINNVISLHISDKNNVHYILHSKSIQSKYTLYTDTLIQEGSEEANWRILIFIII